MNDSRLRCFLNRASSLAHLRSHLRSHRHGLSIARVRRGGGSRRNRMSGHSLKDIFCFLPRSIMNLFRGKKLGWGDCVLDGFRRLVNHGLGHRSHWKNSISRQQNARLESFELKTIPGWP